MQNGVTQEDSLLVPLILDVDAASYNTDAKACVSHSI